MILVKHVDLISPGIAQIIYKPVIPPATLILISYRLTWKYKDINITTSDTLPSEKCISIPSDSSYCFAAADFAFGAAYKVI